MRRGVECAVMGQILHISFTSFFMAAILSPYQASCNIQHLNYFELENTANAVMETYEESAPLGHIIKTIPVQTLLDCILQCIQMLPSCMSLNFAFMENDSTNICQLSSRNKDFVNAENFVKNKRLTYAQFISNSLTKVFGDESWILIARFSNKDSKNWVSSQKSWWFDVDEQHGETLSPDDNGDMISKAFWLQTGSEFKITRSDDLTHTALLTTTGDCLNGTTFRSKMASYGMFRGSDNWASDKCLGNCSVVYGGMANSTNGFNHTRCDGSIQARNKIGFWCDYGNGDGSVMMIGGGGKGCARADHGIGITEENSASFKDGSSKYDFGAAANANFPQSDGYSLNLWIRDRPA